jgi:hypothetical protein
MVDMDKLASLLAECEALKKQADEAEAIATATHDQASKAADVFREAVRTHSAAVGRLQDAMNRVRLVKIAKGS